MTAIAPGPMPVHDWRRSFKLITPGRKEVISKMFWHRQAYTSGTTTTITFFNAATSPPTGNMPLGGQLPNGNSFLIQALGIYFELQPTRNLQATPATELDVGVIRDLQQLIHTGWAELRIGEKDYGEWPIWKLQAGAGPYVDLSAAASLTAPDSYHLEYAQNGPPDIRSVYSLPVPLAVPPQYNFTVKLTWASAITLAPAQSPNIVPWLDGQLMRPVQ